MKLIVGLGNPGSSYAKTRHNAGRRVVEALARESKIAWKPAKNLKSRWAEIEGEDPFLLAFPELFMNESGEAVRLLVSHFGIDFKKDLLVIVDDAALPLGRLRLRASGTDGGHRGLRSIEEALGSRRYSRLRVGVGPSDSLTVPLEHYVLSPFEKSEEEKLKIILERCLESCRRWFKGPFERAMDWTNRPAS